jgi:dolichol-phosphate mannosyltransferase
MTQHYKIAILLSTYNGATYLPELLASLSEQRYKNWMLFWRDDGSSDGSVAMVEAFSTNCQEGKVCRLEDDGEHLGPLGSFLRLLRHAPEFAFNFAFCDQDDIWLPEKLDRAVGHIQSVRDTEPVLYCSRVNIVDADLREIGQTPHLRNSPGIANALTQNIAIGCTIVLNGAARKRVISILPPERTMHDWWCYIVVAAAGGQIIFDNEPGILYRQHGANAIGIPPSMAARLTRACARGPTEFLELLYGHVNSLKQGNRHLTKETVAVIKRTNRIFMNRGLLRLWGIFRLGLYRQGFIETVGLYVWLTLTIISRGWHGEAKPKFIRLSAKSNNLMHAVFCGAGSQGQLFSTFGVTRPDIEALDAAHPALSAEVPHTAPRLAVIVPCYNERANVAPMVEKLASCLDQIAWEVIFVDDDSPDGTADAVLDIATTDARVRLIRRIGRRGLSSAVIEGALATTAEFVSVIDGDLQHDETILPAMLNALEAGADLAVGSRHVDGGDAAGLSSPRRELLSNAGIRIARTLSGTTLTDPMSGFFMLRRDLFAALTHRLTGQGFKILLDLVLTAPAPLKVVEIPYQFRSRAAGESKLDALVLIQFAGLLIDKLLGGQLPLRFIAFAMVGGFGVLVNLLAMQAGRRFGLDFNTAQIVGTIVAMVVNFELNNRLTYRMYKLKRATYWRGLALFILVCSLGAVANIGIARTLYAEDATGVAASSAGAAIGVVWNYAVSTTLIWRAP